MCQLCALLPPCSLLTTGPHGRSLVFLLLLIPTLEANRGQAPFLPSSLPPQSRVKEAICRQVPCCTMITAILVADVITLLLSEGTVGNANNLVPIAHHSFLSQP